MNLLPRPFRSRSTGLALATIGALTLACGAAFAQTAPPTASAPQQLTARMVAQKSAEVPTASGTAAADNPAIRQTIRDINPNAVVRTIDQMPIQGLKRVVADSTVVYVTDDGRYLLYGVLLDTVTHRNLTDEALGEARKDLLRTIPAEDKIIFSPKDPKYTVTIFTDTSCHYCQLLHKSIKGYLDAGIRIEYVPFPRGGLESPELAKMKSVWCSSDRAKAYELAIAGQQVPATNCSRAGEVEKMYDLGDKLGIEGTPAIFDQTGRQLGGFLPPAAMVSKLAGSDKATARAAGTQEPAPAAQAKSP
ncbi:thioredoxin fold domain-containing protein (plasmid) [Dyella sp. BiH032]|uniref:disulfide isomerase DsbC N-terminal domain-containing protein n=1 Tax=Dyella sp. BiH032 TaxID=3075430 RepID=UPI002892DF38|nr:thioredoxin fold domain-containing protein [Dyella sp. BiH032]WNL48476.1 thioredoxin fold domain-containing protein [Dyella sp. BiH032]